LKPLSGNITTDTIYTTTYPLMQLDFVTKFKIFSRFKFFAKIRWIRGELLAYALL